MTDLPDVDLDALLHPLSPTSPCGENLEYDPTWLTLELAQKGKPEVQYGDTITAAVPPDWKQVRQLALDLLARGRDLRTAMALAHALLRLHGIDGFARGLALLEGMLAQHWQHIHPQLDPADNNDPATRVNTLAALGEPAMLRAVRDTPLIASRVHGRIALRQVEIAHGECEPNAGEEATTTAAIDAAFAEAGADAALQSHAAFERAHASVTHIEHLLTEQVGSARACDLSALATLLKRARDTVANYVVSAAIDAGEGATTGTTQPPANVHAGPVASRDDVIRLLGSLCDYYTRHEPSSPIPLLLLRAQRLVDKDFLTIMCDIAPDALPQVRQLGGIAPE